MKTYGGVDIWIHIFLTSALAGGEWTAPLHGRFTPLPPGEKDPGTHWKGRWMDFTTGLDDVEKRKFLALPGLKIRPFNRPARRKTLYRLLYPY
jgi:hypothetical protein